MGLSTEENVKFRSLSALAVLALGGAFVSLPASAQTAPAATLPAKPTVVAPADWEKDGKAFVDGLLKELSGAAGQAGTPAQEQQRFESILARKLAVQRMGAFLLGSARTTATPVQLQEYNQLVPGYIAHSFAEKINDLVAQNLVLGAVQTRSPREVIVTSSFERRGGQGTVKVNWRLIKESAGIKVLDVSVNGVPALAVQREEFAALVKRGGFDALLTRLRTVAA